MEKGLKRSIPEGEVNFFLKLAKCIFPPQQNRQYDENAAISRIGTPEIRWLQRRDHAIKHQNEPYVAQAPEMEAGKVRDLLVRPFTFKGNRHLRENMNRVSELFERNDPFLTGAWILIMIGAADISIVSGCRLRMNRLAGGLFLALLAGTVIPLLIFVPLVLQDKGTLDAQYAVPISGMSTRPDARYTGSGRLIRASLFRSPRMRLNRFAQGAVLPPPACGKTRPLGGQKRSCDELRHHPV